MLKKIGLGLAALVVVILIASQFLWSNLDRYVKQAIDTYGTAATRAPVNVDGVRLSLTTGEGTLKGLSIGSPPGFTAKQSIYFGVISMRIDTQSLAGDGPVVINDITIDKPKITYEVTPSGNNLDTLARNARDYASGPQAREQRSAPAATAGSKSGRPGDVASSNRKLIIDSLTITGGEVATIHPMLRGRKVSTDLPSIHMTGIGRSEGGATPAEIAQLVVNEITRGAAQAAAKDMTRKIGNIDSSGIGSGIKGLFGK